MDELITDRHTPAPTRPEVPAMARRNARLDIITRSLTSLIPGGSRSNMAIVVTERDPSGAAHTWTGTVDGLAERLCTAMYGRGPTAADSPLTQAEDAKRRRDLPGEIGALMNGQAQLHAAPWYPSQPGDLVHIAREAIADVAAWGETYAVDEGTEAGQLWMRLLHRTLPSDGDLLSPGYYTGCSDDPMHDIWVEAGPSRITVVRDGAVIPNRAASL